MMEDDKENQTMDATESLSGSMPYLPQDIIEEILVRLPVKSLLKFRCVSKSWLSSISSPKFIKTHVAYSTLDPTLAGYSFVLCISNRPFRVKQFSVSSVFRDRLADAVEAEFPTNIRSCRSSSIVGSCNGLLCVRVYNYREMETPDIFLWNPCLRISKKLPPISTAEKDMAWAYTYGIGYDEPKDDYRVVRLFQHSSAGVTVEYYSLKNDSWKKVKGFKGGTQMHSSVIYANGKFHFQAFFENDDGVCTSGWAIVSLDLENEVYEIIEHPEIEEPESDDYCYVTSIGVLKGCITALYSYAWDYADVWLLKEYGVKESWTKFVRIPYDGGCLYWNPFCVLSNGKVLFGRGKDIVVYNPEDNSLLYARNGDRDAIRWKVTYVESLVPLPS